MIEEESDPERRERLQYALDCTRVTKIEAAERAAADTVATLIDSRLRLVSNEGAPQG
jgi:hypothetical protein